jgi:hypothetical protein
MCHRSCLLAGARRLAAVEQAVRSAINGAHQAALPQCILRATHAATAPQVEVYKFSGGSGEPSIGVVRACIAGVPPGYQRLEVREVPIDDIWCALRRLMTSMFGLTVATTRLLFWLLCTSAMVAVHFRDMVKAQAAYPGLLGLQMIHLCRP